MRVAFVVQRAGSDVTGGAELLCLQVAQHMGRHWETEILTTCARDYMTWQDDYPPGLQEFEGTTIRRFRVDHTRDVPAFDRMSAALISRGAEASREEQEDWMRAQGPMSTDLLRYITEHAGEYDAFIFFGYLYATTYFGLPLVQDKAYLAPFAHDEWPIHFSMWDDFILRPKEIIYSTPFERAFILRRFPRASLSGPVIGIGIDLPEGADGERFRAKYGLEGPFLLYAGRIDESKGCRWLVENFVQARDAGAVTTRLVFIGNEVMPVPFHDDMIYLGFVSDEEKRDAMAACDWMVMPSPHESLSIALLETWAVGRPAIVNAASEVLVGQCRRADGGLWYHDQQDFIAILQTVGTRTKNKLGAQGQRFVSAHYSWERVEREYLRLLSSDRSGVG